VLEALMSVRCAAVLLLTALAGACGNGSGDGNGGASDPAPIFTFTSVDLSGPYNPATMRFGDVLFQAPVLIPFGEDLGGGNLSPAIEYFTVPGAPVRACSAGVVTAVAFNMGQGDFEVRIAPFAGSKWLVIYDHVLNVAVAEGQNVAAGMALGDAGNWSPMLRRTELQINDEDANLSFCPLDFGDADFVMRHAELLAAFNAQGFGPLASLCLVPSVTP